VTRRAWWRDAVFYQIYPRSFADSNGDGVGDLPGIIAHLDHLRGSPASLGVDAIWLSPFYQSPMADFGYDVTDHCAVDPLFGTLDDFDRLLTEAHRRGLRMIVDLVPNHTSDLHPWFRESRSSRTNPKRDWYVWRDAHRDGDAPPNNWLAAFGGGWPAWTKDLETGAWYLHSFLPSQPDLNWENPAVEAAIHDVMRFWLRRGVDGFRIDAVHKLGKAPDLRDNHGSFTGAVVGDRGLRFDEDWPTVHGRLARMRAVAREFGDRVLVGEVYILDPERLAAYLRSGRGLDLAHNFSFLRLPWRGAAFAHAVSAFEGLVGRQGWPAWCLNNHDHSRVATRYASERAARVAAMLVLTLRGTPFLYQGEELGLEDGVIPPERVVDVEGRDPERCPIPWVDPAIAGVGAGFTSGRPGLPLPPDAGVRNVATETADPASVLALYRHLLAVRTGTPALKAGAFESISSEGDVFAYRRRLGHESIAVYLNFGSGEVPLRGRGSVLASTLMAGDPGTVDGSFELGPVSGLVVKEQ
jgi:alpha-glucosidase